MPTKHGKAPISPAKPKAPPTTARQVQSVLATLERRGTKRTREGMSRYGITAKQAFGVTMAHMQELAKELGRNHELAIALWETEWYEARMLATLIDEPARVTSAQMDRWRGDFDNWAICDTACFHLFDRTPHAFRKVAQWCDRRDEFGRRAAFALLASLALHDKRAGDEQFLETLPMIEEAATDDRNFVKKSVNWALRAIGKRNPALRSEAVSVARRLSNAPAPSARWVGKDALRELMKPVKPRRLAKR